MPVSLKEQVVLVIGASSGIGRATAALFAAQGARVIASARRQERLDSLCKECSGIEAISADAARASDMQKVAQHVIEKYGRIDILVHSAGTNIKDRALKRLNTDLWDMMVSVNLNSAYYITNAVLPSMRERRAGHLIFISSVSGLIPDVSGASYQAAKRGVVALAHAIRVEEKENNIRTCVICPGLVDTEILENRPVKPSAETLAQALQPEDVAEAVLAVAQLPPRAVVPEMQILPTTL